MLRKGRVHRRGSEPRDGRETRWSGALPAGTPISERSSRSGPELSLRPATVSKGAGPA
jgi:hypothetical protein